MFQKPANKTSLLAILLALMFLAVPVSADDPETCDPADHDTDSDGLCDKLDPDDDNDGAPDCGDPNPKDYSDLDYVIYVLKGSSCAGGGGHCDNVSLPDGDAIALNDGTSLPGGTPLDSPLLTHTTPDRFSCDGLVSVDKFGRLV